MLLPIVTRPGLLRLGCSVLSGCLQLLLQLHVVDPVGRGFLGKSIQLVGDERQDLRVTGEDLTASRKIGVSNGAHGESAILSVWIVLLIGTCCYRNILSRIGLLAS